LFTQFHEKAQQRTLLAPQRNVSIHILQNKNPLAPLATPCNELSPCGPHFYFGQWFWPVIAQDISRICRKSLASPKFWWLPWERKAFLPLIRLLSDFRLAS